MVKWEGDSMIIGVLTAHLHLHVGPGVQEFRFVKGPQNKSPRKNGKTGGWAINSLKQKRSVVKSLIGRLKARFNVSVAEVDHQDNKTRAVIAVAMVSNDTRFIDKQFDAIIAFMRRDGRFYLGEIERETF
jgi:uncharacterized protein YlxP (DUF503 family)